MGLRGLSPRVRGNRQLLSNHAKRLGSIPARAGQPHAGRQSERRRTVYPRACGATLSPKCPPAFDVGLSPRVRGNPADLGVWGKPRRSIPARAGQPAGRGVRYLRAGVYPRACGATYIGVVNRIFENGLSPRVRGNLANLTIKREEIRSIPARAGQPPISLNDNVRYKVYPRACGATTISVIPSSVTGGLSPRVRGNHSDSLAVVGIQGSIPARAGQPVASDNRKAHKRVYPRACGATIMPNVSFITSRGLSPRVRGNPQESPYQPPLLRSIPARAGQPDNNRRYLD